MSTYSNLADAFNNGDLMELDRMADDINNSKKKKLAKSIQDDINDTYTKSKSSINGLDKFTSQYYPQSNQDFKYFSTQGDFNLNEQNDHNKTTDTNSLQTNTELHTFNNSINTASSIDNAKDKTVHKKTYFKKLKELADSIKSMHHDDISSASSDSMEDTVDHLKHCNTCRKKLSLILKGKRKSEHLFNNIIVEPEIIQTHQPQYNSLFTSLTKLDFRDILLIILIIVIIVLIVDIFTRRK